MPPIISIDAPILETHEVTITYLEQLTRAALPHVPRPSLQTALMQVKAPPTTFYRYLFETIGTPHKWVSRRYISDEKLLTLIHREDTRIYALYKEGWPAGFAEIVDKKDDGYEIKFLGLVPEAQNLGLGRWFLHEVIALIWDQNPHRIFIETCTLDSPGALRLYQRMGFNVYAQAKGIVEWRG